VPAVADGTDTALRPFLGLAARSVIGQAIRQKDAASSAMLGMIAFTLAMIPAADPLLKPLIGVTVRLILLVPVPRKFQRWLVHRAA